MFHALVFTFCQASTLFKRFSHHCKHLVRFIVVRHLGNPIHSSSISVKTFFLTSSCFHRLPVWNFEKNCRVDATSHRPYTMASPKELEFFPILQLQKCNHQCGKFGVFGDLRSCSARLLGDYELSLLLPTCFSFTFYFVKNFSKRKIVWICSEFGANHLFVLSKCSQLCLSFCTCKWLGNVVSRFFTSPDRCDFHMSET